MDNQNEISLLNEVNEARGLDLDKILEAGTSGDKEVPIFLLEWLNNGFNASEAYKKLHPEVSDGSARVLGSRKLTKVNKTAILDAYEIGIEKFFDQLKQGLEATKQNQFTGDFTPDHKTRLEYLRILGKLLSITE